MIVTPACHSVSLSARFLILILHQIDSVVRNGRTVFVLICDYLLWISFLLFVSNPIAMGVLSIWPRVVMIQRFALNCTACDSFG